ncbi:MAG: RICIN domain-containing protein [Actinoplanes sp.]
MTVFAGPVPANAADPLRTFISVLTPQGNPPTDANRMVLDVPNGDTANGTPAQIWRRNTEPQQIWEIHPLNEYSNGYRKYKFYNMEGNGCLDMATDGPVGDLTRVQQWGCGNKSNQKWIAYPVGAGETVRWMHSSWPCGAQSAPGPILRASGSGSPGAKIPRFAWCNARPPLWIAGSGSWMRHCANLCCAPLSGHVLPV